MANEEKTFKVEGAELIYKNFAGEKSAFNATGKREVSVVLSPEFAETLLADGWNVRQTKPDEDGEFRYYITMEVSFKFRPPRIVMITAGGRTNVSEDMLNVLDYARFSNVDLIARSYYWNVGDKKGMKAFLQTMFLTLEEDELERKYGINEV